MQEGLLTLPSLIKLLKFIHHSASEQLVPVKAEFMRERLGLEGVAAQENLHRVIFTQLNTIERICDETLHIYQVKPKIFDRSLKAYASNAKVMALTDRFIPLSNSTFTAKDAPADLSLATFFDILKMTYDMLKHELKIRRELSCANMVALQALIADSVFLKFGYDETQVAAASAKYEGHFKVVMQTQRIRVLQKLLVSPRRRV